MAVATAKNTLLKISADVSPRSYATIAEVRSIDGPTSRHEIVDITTHDLSGLWRKKLAVLIDPGTVSFAINFNKAEATHAYATGLWNYFLYATRAAFQQIFPSSNGTLDFEAYVTQHAFAAPVDNVLQANIELAITEAIAGS